jgi:putative endonuclease
MRGTGKEKKVRAYKLGKSGEDIAIEYLKRKKYKIVCKGFRFLRGEIDIIAYDGDALVFIEVKTRKNTQFSQPEESVTHAKRKQLRRVAQGYLLREHIQDVECRFDVLSLSYDEFKGYKVKHFVDAF